MSTTPSSSTGPGTPASERASERASFRAISKLPSFAIPPLPASLKTTRNEPRTLSATYLPDVVTAQGWTHLDALDSAIRKAGYDGAIDDALRRSLRVTRYKSTKAYASHEQWRLSRRERVPN